MKYLFLFISIITSIITYSQDISINTSAGFAVYGNPFDGYYFSSNISFPIIKGVDISPSFMFMSNNTNYNKVTYYWNTIHEEQYIINDEKSNGSDSSGLFELFLIIKPLKYIKNDKISKIDFGIGTGYGISIYSEIHYNYNDLYPNDGLVGVISKNGIRQSMSIKSYYNYHIKKYHLGISIGLHDFIDSGEGASTVGIQFGIKL
jgi:hypothetical protein